MAKELNTKNKLEKNGIIHVIKYYRDKFKKSSFREIECDNCNNKQNHAHVYEYINGSIINICFFCNKKINNINTQNRQYRKQPKELIKY